MSMAHRLSLEQLDQAETLCRRLGPANCWTGCGGSLASLALWMVGELQQARRKEQAMRLIGITGRAGAGKNTVAAMVPGAVTIQLADPLYAMVAAMTGFPESILRDRAWKERALPGIGKSPRQLLQTLGTEWGRDIIDRDIWLTLCQRRVEQLAEAGWETVVVADIRFDNEAAWVRRSGGEVWEVVRHHDGIGQGVRYHSSEAGVSPDLVDRRIVNDGSLDELRAAVALSGPVGV